MVKKIKIIDDKDNDLPFFDSKDFQSKTAKEVSEIIAKQRARHRHFIFVTPTKPLTNQIQRR